MRRRLRWLSVLPVLATLLPVQSAAASTLTFGAAMQQAAQARQVPLPLIEAVAYVNSRWEVIGRPAADGGVGPMHVLPSQMNLAATLSGHIGPQIAGDTAANLDAGAALLAHAHSSGADLVSWRAATAATQGPRVAAQVFDVLRTGASRITSTGERITVDPQPIPIDNRAAPSTVAPASADYSPAAWVPADPANYSVGDRPHDYSVDMIIIHDTEGSYGSAIQLFQDPAAQASAHYVVSDAGDLTQMVAEHDIAWHAGNWDYNTRAIGIEHEGYAYSPDWYTTAMYQTSARLSASICSRWGVLLDRQHVIGHSEVPDPNNPGLFGGVDHHTDPGPYWDWIYYMSLAQGYASALPSPPHLVLAPYVVPKDGGATVSWPAARSCRLAVDSYKVVLQPGNIVLNLSGTTTSATFTGLQNGATYSFSVTASNPDGQDSLSTTIVPSPPCTTPTLSASLASPAATGASVVFSATTSTCFNPRYRFWVQPPGGSWQVARSYSSASTFNWTQTGFGGSYGIEVDVIQLSSSVGYDAVRNLAYVLNGCTGARLTTDWPSPQPPGSTVVLTGSASCPGTPEYRFWVQPPGGSWGIVHDYSTDSFFNWDTSGKPAGGYSLEVDVRDQRATDTYETVANITYVLGPAHCGVPTLSVSPGSPAATGTGVTFTAGTAGCSNPLFRFWIEPPGGPWSVVLDYSSTNAYNWITTGIAGSYGVEVDVRNQAEGNSVSYDQVNNMTYVLNGCTGGNLTAAPPSPHAPGGTTFLTGSATCAGTPAYRFWIQQPGDQWTVVQNYSTSNTYNWPTTGLPIGSYGLEVDIRNQGGTDSYETVGRLTYVLAVTPCTTPALTAAPQSPGATGAIITFNFSTSGCPNSRFRFWIQPPGGPWTIQQDYSASSSFSWSTTGTAGRYGVEVDVRDASSTASYDAVFNTTYTVVGCSAAGLTAAPASPQPHGTPVVLTATSTCPGTASYRFWILDPGASHWSMVQDYSASNTYSWAAGSTMAVGTYMLEVDVRDQGGTDTYEAVFNSTYVVT